MYRRPPSLRKNRERRRLWITVVNRVPVYICINYFVLSVTVEKAHVGRKIALASVHRLAEHLHAMSRPKIQISDLWLQSSQGRDPFNQNSDRSDREKRTTSKGGPVFWKLFRLDRTDPLSFGPKFPEILVEWIAPQVKRASQDPINVFVIRKLNRW